MEIQRLGLYTFGWLEYLLESVCGVCARAGDVCCWAGPRAVSAGVGSDSPTDAIASLLLFLFLLCWRVAASMLMEIGAELGRWREGEGRGGW